MKAIILRTGAIASLLLAVAIAGTMPIFSDTAPSKQRQRIDDNPAGKKRDRLRRTATPLSYRSPGSSHKLLVQSSDAETEGRILSSGAARRVRKYGSYTLIEVDDPLMSSLDAGVFERAQLRDDLNLILLKRGQIDTTGQPPDVRSDLRQKEGLPYSLHMVQLFGPPTPATVGALSATGAKIISYIPNNAYLIWASRAELQRVRALRRQSDAVQWEGPFHPAYKLDKRIALDSGEPLSVSIIVVSTPDADRTIARIKSLAEGELMPQFESSSAIHMRVTARGSDLAELARMPDVMAIEPWVSPRLSDERANQIVANAVAQETTNNVTVVRPAQPGYLAFLNSAGFNTNFDFAVDIADTGFDLGSADAARVHQDFLDGAGASRIAYLNDHTGDSSRHGGDPNILPAHDTLGHGTLNASIAGGLNVKADDTFRDFLGFQYGLGTAPFTRIGISKIFDDNGNIPFSVSFEGYISAAYQGGARISSNSWGVCGQGFCNLYTGDSFLYDNLVRDADSQAFGNQEMTIIFSAGNDGSFLAGSISIPATAKNVITVGASEGFRSKDAQGNNLVDGCGVGAGSADNAFDIVGFSADGPVEDGRAKPDIVAPGTHITGAASQDNFFATNSEFDLGVCDRYFPDGQTFYTWSTGTSHSTPIIAGGTALGLHWLKERLGTEPSPALVKAFLLNSTTYLTGNLAGGDLPGSRQGWGALNLSRMFEETDRIIHDQSPERTFTESGGKAFETTGVITDQSKEFRVMLVWTDAPGNPFVNAPYVNQLNLEVIVGGVLYDGNNFSGEYSEPGGGKDFLNNVQAVRLPAGTTGTFVVRVRPTVIAGDGIPGNGINLDQDFALVVTNGRQEAVPVLSVEDMDGVSSGVTVMHSNGASDSSLIPGEAAKISVEVSNESLEADADINSATLLLNAAQSSTSAFPVIEGGAAASNESPFEIGVPSSLRCGSIARFQLRLETSLGQITLPVNIRVGREVAGGPEVLLDDDVDGGRVKWKKKKGFGTSTLVGNSGSQSYHVEDTGDNGTRQGLLILKKKVKIPSDAGNIRLTFFHIFDFEPGYDGGVLEITADSGQTWQDLGSRILVGGYNGRVTELSSNPLGDRFSWTSRGRTGVFSQVVIDLDDFAGQTIKLRFIGGFDEATGVAEGFTGWFIDDIRITMNRYSCSNPSSASPDLSTAGRQPSDTTRDASPVTPRQYRLSSRKNRE